MIKKAAITRRKYLGRLLGAAASAAGLWTHGMPGARAQEAGERHYTQLRTPVTEPNEFCFSRLRFKTIGSTIGHWNVGPQGEEFLLTFLREATNIRISRLSFQERVVGIDEFEQIHRQPFLFMTGENDFELTDDEAATLGEFFRRGGFLYADDCVDNRDMGDHFYQAFIQAAKRLLPGTVMEPVPPKHEIYHCFFDMPGGQAPWCQGQHRPDMGLFYEGRLVCFLTSGDVHCGWGKLYHLFPKETIENCWRMGVNIIVYALTH